MTESWPTFFTALALSFQGLLMGIDEFKYHRRRGLGTWESWGHPLDSFFYLVPLAVAAWAVPTSFWITVYCGGAVASSLLITKDQWVHSRECEAAENFLHALLFVIHPTIFFGVAYLWISQTAPALRQGAAVVVGLFGIYQWAYWRGKKKRAVVDNSFYEELGDRWYEDDAHAVALLRVESRKKLEYVREVLAREKISEKAAILDIGCGAGFISNPLATLGFHVKGIDLSASSVETARRRAPAGGRATYEAQDAYALREPDQSRDVILMLDFLEHVDQPLRAIREAVRVLKPGGTLVTHTFNRTPLANLLAVHGITFVAKDCPPHVHVYSLFVKPGELVEMGKQTGLRLLEMRGIRPKVFCRAFFLSLLRRRVHPDFTFVFTSSLTVGYLGTFKKDI